MEILEKAMQQAINLLNSCGARYHIVGPDGTAHGEPIKPAKARRTRTVNPDLPSYRAMFLEKIAPMSPGDVVILHPAEGDSLARLQSNLGAFCLTKFGKGGGHVAPE